MKPIKYFLMAKINNKSFTQYRGNAIRLSEKIPKTFDEVYIGLKGYPDKTRKITTFKDADGNIIERIFDYSDGKLRNRLYNTEYTQVFSNKAVKSVSIKDMYLNKRVVPYYKALLEDYEQINPLKTILWNLTESITNHLYLNKSANEKVLSQVRISRYETPAKQRHTFVEYPHIINNKITDTKKKILSFFANSKTSKVLKDGKNIINVKEPVSDSFLAFRALDVCEAREPLTLRFLKERKLANKGISIDPYYYPKDEDEKLYMAHFDPADGSINFNRQFKHSSKSLAVATARHEVEHGWQYYLRARAAMPTTDWESYISDTYGSLHGRKLVREAKRYYKSIQNYKPLSMDMKESGKIDEYKNSYIEWKADKAGRKAKKQYDIEGKTIREDFKYIPQRFL